jgi:hypothetical protein
MTFKKDEKVKKVWSTPKLEELSIKKTLGGPDIFTGEDDYADPNPTSGVQF